MRVIRDFYPNYSDLAVHESSPGGRGVSLKLVRECAAYSYSHYFEDVEPGQLHSERGERCENIENLTFPDNSFDLFITQDVMEHIFDPAAAFREIARVLKPGGAHIFTAPLVNRARPSERRADLLPDRTIRHYKKPEYHGNPVDPGGSLVTMDWGYDIAARIMSEAGMPSLVIQIDDVNSGIRAEFIEVIVSMKH